MKKFLVIQTASIGDVVLSTSLLEELHYNYPSEKIDILLKKGNESLFAQHPFVGKVWVWDKKDNKYLNLIKLIRELRKTEYEFVININRFFSSGLITTFSNSSQKIGFKKNPLSKFFDQRIEHIISKHKFIHEIDRNFRLIASICEDDESKVLSPRLYPDKISAEKVIQYKNQIYYTVSPSSLWFTKQFHKEGWIEFLKQVPKDCSIYLLGSKSDIKLCNEIKKEINHPNCINLAGKLSFLESTSLMDNAKMNFTNDSAPMHFCSSVNAPTTAIFCSTVPSFGFTPLSDNSKIIQTKEKLECRPCGLHGYKKCPQGHFNCSKTIKIKELVNRL
ncbi:MAG: glycosyltransferase family 9 protein [Bacteroidales bacterium]|nr:glycosyltransferase family 9 protein [Bacteroidales bacterium]